MFMLIITKNKLFFISMPTLYCTYLHTFNLGLQEISELFNSKASED